MNAHIHTSDGNITTVPGSNSSGDQATEFTLTLSVQDNTLSVETSQGITLPDAMSALCHAAISMMRQTHQHISANPPEGVTSEKIKEDLYDMANLMFSNVLQQFAPEIEMRPDLTCEAILKAENEILDAQS